MGYYMRYISTDEQSVTLAELLAALKGVDPRYDLSDVQTMPSESGILLYDRALYGEIDINRRGDGLFDEELSELQEALDEARGRTDIVRQVLDGAKTIVAVRVLWQERKTEATLSRLDPLWEWLSANRTGLLQADEEGYYDGSTRIVQV